jgi:phenylacetic acid degradation protein
MIYSFEGFRPVVHESAFVHPQASIIGNVIIGKEVYIGPGAAIRGDWGRIEVGDGANIQENCVVHMFPGVTVVLEEMAHIGHGAVIHGARIGRNALIGMNAVIMDKAEVGAESIVGALSFVRSEMQIPERSLVVGNPAKVLRKVEDKMVDWKTLGTGLYRKLPAQSHEGLVPCEPLREEESDRPTQRTDYLPWSK